jgi:hypothetical protein
MAIRSKLAQSSITVFMFNWVLLTVGFSLLNIEQVQSILNELRMDYNDLNNFNLIHAQLLISSKWIGHTFALIFVSGFSAFILSWAGAYFLDIKRTKRFSGKGEFRGVSCSIGELPTPKRESVPQIGIEIPVKEFSDKHQNLINEIFSLIKAKNVPAGLGHGNNLFEHTVNVVNKAIEINKIDPNLLCALAGHDIGKVETFKKGKLKQNTPKDKKSKSVNDYEWTVEGKHDEVGARIVALFDSWWEMEERDQNIIFYAIKYSHKPTQLPTTVAYYDDVCKCLEELRHVDHNVTGEEKEEVTKEIEDTRTLLEYFKQFLQETPLRTSNTIVGNKSGGWVKHGKIFVLENYFRETFLRENYPEVLASFNELSKSKQHSRVTKALLQQLNSEGILVKEWNDFKISKTSDALWVIKAGKAQFGKVIIIDLNEELTQFVGTATYTKGISVLSTYGQYLREKHNENSKGRPKANVNTVNSTQSKIKDDLNKIKAAKKDSSNSPQIDADKKPVPNNHPTQNSTAKKPEKNNHSADNRTDKKPVPNNNSAHKHADKKPVPNNHPTQNSTDKKHEKNNHSADNRTDKKPLPNNNSAHKHADKKTVPNNHPTQNSTDKKPEKNNHSADNSTDNKSALNNNSAHNHADKKTVQNNHPTQNNTEEERDKLKKNDNRNNNDRKNNKQQNPIKLKNVLKQEVEYDEEDALDYMYSIPKSFSSGNRPGSKLLRLEDHISKEVLFKMIEESITNIKKNKPEDDIIKEKLSELDVERLKDIESPW